MVSVTVVGVCEDGCLGLSSRTVNEVAKARVVAGHPRHMAWFPQFDGLFLDMTQGFSEWLNEVIDESEEGDVVILASGDPLFYGIGSTLLKRLNREELRFIPSLTSGQQAFARLGLPWAQARFLSVHGRPLNGLVSQMQQGDLFAILTDYKNTPQVVAAHLQQFQQDWTLTVCEQLASVEEKISRFSVDELAQEERVFDPLNLLIAERNTTPSRNTQIWGGFGQFASDECFSKRVPQNGLITKQAVRHLALTEMKIGVADTVWDIGAGSGSVSIEAAKFCWQGNVFAIESNPDCYTSIQDNIYAHATDNVTLIEGLAPEALAGLAAPDAIFIGGRLIASRCCNISSISSHSCAGFRLNKSCFNPNARKPL